MFDNPRFSRSGGFIYQLLAMIFLEIFHSLLIKAIFIFLLSVFLELECEKNHDQEERKSLKTLLSVFVVCSL